MRTRLVSIHEGIPERYYEFEKKITSEGSISITLDRNNDFFSSSLFSNNKTFALIAEKKNEICAIASLGKVSMGARDLFTGETLVLSGVKRLPSLQKGVYIRKGIEILWSLFERLSVNSILFFVMNDNHEVIKMMKKKRSRISIVNLGTFKTYVIPLSAIGLSISTEGLKKSKHESLHVSRVDSKSADHFYAFIEKQTKNHFMCPYLSVKLLKNNEIKGLDESNFYILKKNNHIIASLGFSDQSAYRSWMVNKYRGILEYARMAKNIQSALFGGLYFPKVFEKFNTLHAIFPFCENSCTEYFPFLLDQASKDFMKGKLNDSLTVCVHEKNNLNEYVSILKGVCLESSCFLMLPGSDATDQNDAMMSALTKCTPQVETCIL